MLVDKVCARGVKLVLEGPKIHHPFAGGSTVADQDPSEKKPISLDPDDITEVPSSNRRSALASIGALVGAAIGIVVLKPEDAEACRRRTGRTDSDGGPNADGMNRGHTGVTDSDSGDESNCGRGGGRVVRSRRGCTDTDSGRYADGVGRGRHCR
jgi:hypothetical protein